MLKVRKDAAENDIKKAVELLFGEFSVAGVTVVNVRGKNSVGGVRGRRSDWKKAYVTLAEGSSLDAVLGTE